MKTLDKMPLHETPAIQSEGINSNPPNSNTGGKQERKNKAGNAFEQRTGLIDFLTIVISDLHFRPSTGEAYDHDQFIEAVNKGFLSNLGLVAQPTLRGGKNFYSHSWDITDNALNTVGFVAHGNNKDSLCISISGSGTQLIGSAGFIFVKDWLDNQGGHITRIDIAHDCFNGEKTVEDAINWYQQGVFRSGKHGTPPTAKLVDDFESRAGKTLYVGNRKSGKLLRVYEKGKQLGDKNSKWVRFELELRSTDRVIPPSILLDAGDYLSGSYDCMQWVSIKQSYVTTQQKTAEVTFQHLTKHCKQAYGRLFNVMLAVFDTPDELIQTVLRDDGFPRRLNHMKETARE